MRSEEGREKEREDCENAGMIEERKEWVRVEVYIQESVWLSKSRKGRERKYIWLRLAWRMCVCAATSGESVSQWNCIWNWMVYISRCQPKSLSFTLLCPLRSFRFTPILHQPFIFSSQPLSSLVDFSLFSFSFIVNVQIFSFLMPFFSFSFSFLRVKVSILFFQMLRETEKYIHKFWKTTKPKTVVY